MTLDPRRAAIVAAAQSQIGKSDPAPYWLDVLEPPQPHPTDGKGKPLAWCGAFALWCVHRGDVGRDVLWVPGRGFLLVVPLQLTLHPEPGDIAYRQHNQHHAIVAAVNGPLVDTIDGNSTLGRVTLHEGTQRSAWTAFYSIDRLLAVPADPLAPLPPPGESPAKRLQRALTAAGYPCGAIDGAPGPKTQAALLKWALEHPDRIVR